jgi:hypothetical protein
VLQQLLASFGLRLREHRRAQYLKNNNNDWSQDQAAKHQ